MLENSISLTFQKLVLKENSQVSFSKINILVSTIHKIYRLKYPKVIKNNLVNFFGESIAFPSSKHFNIIVTYLDDNDNEKQYFRYYFGEEDYQLLTNRSKPFSVQMQQCTLHWEVKKNGVDDEAEDQTERDLSQIDAKILDFQRKSRRINRNMFSPSQQKPKRVKQMDVQSQSPFNATSNTKSQTAKIKQRPKCSQARRTSSKSDDRNLLIKSITKNNQKQPIFRKIKLKQKKCKKSFINKEKMYQMMIGGIFGAISGAIGAYSM